MTDDADPEGDADSGDTTDGDAEEGVVDTDAAYPWDETTTGGGTTGSTPSDAQRGRRRLRTLRKWHGRLDLPAVIVEDDDP